MLNIVGIVSSTNGNLVDDRAMDIVDEYWRR
jgi:hypothetical protein